MATTPEELIAQFPNASQMDKLIEGFTRQNLLLTRLVPDTDAATPHVTLQEIHEIVMAGGAEHTFGIGDQIFVNYNDGSADYVLPFDIVHFGSVELQDGETVPGMYIQSHYAMQGVQFDGNEAFAVAGADGFPAGTYHFTMGNAWGSNVVANTSYQFTLANSYGEGTQLVLGTQSSTTSGLPDTAPANWRVRVYASSAATDASEILPLTVGTGGTDLGTLSSGTKYGDTGLNNMQRAAYGYNRWDQSGLRQFLNSSADAGQWWTKQNVYDRPPDQLTTMRGFMAGFEEAFLNIIKPVKVRTALNTVSDSEIGTYIDTYDTFFPASLEQEYVAPQLANTEGEYWEYWKRRLGLNNPQATGTGGTNAAHIRYGYNAKTSPQYCRLRSANRGYANSAWYVTTAGYVTSGYATGAFRCAPACVIC